MSNRVFGVDLSAEAKRKADAAGKGGSKGAADGQGAKVEPEADPAVQKDNNEAHEAVKTEVQEEQGKDADVKAEA